MLTNKVLALVRKSVEARSEDAPDADDNRKKVSDSLSLVLPPQWALVAKLATMPAWLQVLIATGVIAMASTVAYMVARFINPVAEFFGLEPLNLSDIPIIGPIAKFLGFDEPETRTVAGTGDLIEDIVFTVDSPEKEAIAQADLDRLPELMKPVTQVPRPVIATTAPRPIQQEASKVSGVPRKLVITSKMTPAPGVPEALEAASKAFNIPLENLYSVAYQESGLGNNTTSAVGSARGLFQFMPKTWNTLREQNPDIAKTYKIGAAYGGSTTDDRSNHMKSAIMYGLLHASDQQMLKVAGVSSGDDQVDAYLTHLLGGPGAIRVLKDYKAKPDQPVSSSVGAKPYKDNSHIMTVKDGTTARPMTLKEFLSNLYSIVVGRSTAFKENLKGTARLTIPPEVAKVKVTPNQAKAPTLSTTTRKTAQAASRQPPTAVALNEAPVESTTASPAPALSGPPQSMPAFRRLPSGWTVSMPSS